MAVLELLFRVCAPNHSGHCAGEHMNKCRLDWNPAFIRFCSFFELVHVAFTFVVASFSQVGFISSVERDHSEFSLTHVYVYIYIYIYICTYIYIYIYTCACIRSLRCDRVYLFLFRGLSDLSHSTC